MTFLEFNRLFPTEKAAIDYFLRVRYGDTLTCPHCGAKVKVYRYRERARACHCKNCNDSFSPFSGTIFEKSATSMVKWFYAVHLFLNGKKGISGCQLQREIGVTYKTAWRMLQCIRMAMGNADMAKAFSVLVEVDETYVGGRPRRENVMLDAIGNPVPSEKEPNKRGRGTDKTPVVGVKERDSGKVYATVALPNEAGQKLTGKQLLEVIDKVTADGTTVVTDDFSGYNILNKKEKYVHLTVNHSAGQFSAGKGVHTNGIENFWSVLKRG
ncbi:MAG: IS1595 family transposase, partial [Treponema sp.]|nr:IS1595 family transposase [Treponema sp.]